MTDIVEVGSARLAVWDEGSGPVVVCLHAGVADSRAWQDILPALVESGMRVIRYDRRGFGSTTAEPEAFSHVEDLWAVLDHLGVQSAVLVGNSQGGRIALDATLDRPDRVDGLVLVASAITGAPRLDPERFDPILTDLDQRLDRAEEAGQLDLVNELEANLWLDGPLMPTGRVTGAARELFLDMNRRALDMAEVGDPQWGDSAWDRLDDIATPTLFITGEQDVAQSNETLAVAARRVPKASHIEIADSAHLPMLDAPDILTHLLLEFLSTT
jgi:pimeloyl-ACP methyl ester carboxylesterase